MQLMASLNGIKVATLLKDKNGRLHFSHTDQWMERSGARPIS
jgi:HipA-like protein